LASALPLATNLEKVNAITTRGGKSTRDPSYPTKTGKTLVVVRWTLDILTPCYKARFLPSSKLGDYIIYDAPDGA
jgi:hypothetical protein